MRPTWLAVATLAMAACATDSSVAVTTEPVVNPPSTTSTPTTSTTVPAGPIEISGRGVVWEEGATYVASVFLTPVAFSPSEPGWRSFGAGDTWMHAT